MKIEEYPSGSDASREAKRKPSVESTEVTTRKHSEISRFKDKLVQENLPKVKNHIIFDVLIPLSKQLIDDFVHMVLFGETRNKTRDSINPSGKVDYRRYYPEPEPRDSYRRNRRRREYSSTSRSNKYRNYDDLLFESRYKARRVKDDMIDVMENEEMVSISDMYDFAEMKCPHTYDDFGWILDTNSDMSDSEIIHIKDEDGRDKYYINLPPAVQLPPRRRR